MALHDCGYWLGMIVFDRMTYAMRFVVHVAPRAPCRTQTGYRCRFNIGFHTHICAHKCGGLFAERNGILLTHKTSL